MGTAFNNPSRAQNLQRKHQEIVAALSEENARLLFARQRASGVEIEVLTAERDMAETPGSKDAESTLADLYEQERLTKLDLRAAEQRIEDLEQRMTAIVSEIADLKE
ncbi:hypothetical protein [Hoeflea sp. TYP-13]|uniref:hypothetical protein n=1 Tax=Hoeflea sp. TYP-13 TaxID=3230023 RepID=UPI0034C5F1FF